LRNSDRGKVQIRHFPDELFQQMPEIADYNVRSLGGQPRLFGQIRQSIKMVRERWKYTKRLMKFIRRYKAENVSL
jgi:hypothetical protein